MKRVLTVLLVFLAACRSLPSSAPQSDALPPTPYPDTPSPAEIEAARVESPSFTRIEMLNELEGWAVT